MELSLSFWFSPTAPEGSGPGRQCHRATESQGCPERHGTPARLQFQTSLGSFCYQNPVQYLRSLNSLKVFFVYLKFNSSWCQDLVAICLFLISMVPYSRQGLWTPDPGLHLDFPPSDLCVCVWGHVTPFIFLPGWVKALKGTHTIVLVSSQPGSHS